MRVVANIGGSVLSPSKGSKRFREYSKAISALIQQHEVYIVVGGGKAARDFIRIGEVLVQMKQSAT